MVVQSLEVMGQLYLWTHQAHVHMLADVGRQDARAVFDEQQVKDELEAAITALRTEIDRLGAERRRLARRCA